jgi:hypothetical protein
VTGMALNDTWLLRMPAPSEGGELDYKKLKWEKRKKVGYVPTTRSGCTMTLWGAKKCVSFAFAGAVEGVADFFDG